MSAARNPHQRWLYAMHCVELRQSREERETVVRKLISMGYKGGAVYPGYMSMILEEVSPRLVDEEFRRNHVRGYAEDVQ